MLVLQGMGYQHYRVCDVSTTEYVMLVLQGVGHGMSVILQDMEYQHFRVCGYQTKFCLKLAVLLAVLLVRFPLQKFQGTNASSKA